jgi:hypothetical protein
MGLRSGSTPGAPSAAPSCAILVLAFAGEQITELAAFLGAEALERFGLPAELAA